MRTNNKTKLFNLFNDYFDRIYVITLKKSTDRHSIFQETLEGLNYKIFYGVDGSQLQVDKLKEDGIYHSHLTKLMKKRIGRRPSEMSPARIGCALSHLEIYKEVLEHKYQRVLIFEDDPVFKIKDVQTVEKAFEELPDDWELLYFGHKGANSNPSILLKFQKNLLWLFAVLVQRFERLRRLDPDVIRCWLPRPYSEHLEISGSHFGTNAYAMSKNGAEKVLNYQTPVVQESDNALAELCSYGWIKAFNLKEQIFIQNRNLPSTINEPK